jgi:hypothetical protein
LAFGLQERSPSELKTSTREEVAVPSVVLMQNERIDELECQMQRIEEETRYPATKNTLDNTEAALR